LARRREDAAVKPGRAGGGAVVLEPIETFEVPAGIIGIVAVDFFEDLFHIRLARDALRVFRLVVPDEVIKPLVAWLRAIGVELLQPLA